MVIKLNDRVIVTAARVPLTPQERRARRKRVDAYADQRGYGGAFLLEQRIGGAVVWHKRLPSKESAMTVAKHRIDSRREEPRGGGRFHAAWLPNSPDGHGYRRWTRESMDGTGSYSITQDRHA